LYDFFDSFSGRISITTDMWSSNQTLGYSCLTTHFIDSDWNLQKKIWNFKTEPSLHTTQNLCSSIYKCLLDWNIDRKISSITLDNCKTNDVMVGMLEELLGNLLLGSDLVHVGCVAHILNLVDQDGLKVMGDAVEKIRESVKYVRGSQWREQTFRDTCEQPKIGTEMHLYLDVQLDGTLLLLCCRLHYSTKMLSRP